MAALAQSERLALFIDEFTYLLEIDPSIAGQLQNLWDHTLSQANLFLVICGSHLGMMLRHTLSYQTPLYERATAQLRLQPLPFGATVRYFPRYDADERVAIYAIWGGIPVYWERINPDLTISENIRHELLTANNLMQAEPRLLLQDFVSDPSNYVGILRAIANEARTQKEISAFTGLGAALLAGAGAGLFSSAAEAANRLLRFTDTYLPDPARQAAYARQYELYRRVYPAIAPITHRL